MFRENGLKWEWTPSLDILNFVRFGDRSWRDFGGPHCLNIPLPHDMALLTYILSFCLDCTLRGVLRNNYITSIIVHTVVLLLRNCLYITTMQKKLCFFLSILSCFILLYLHCQYCGIFAFPWPLGNT